jgi:hypothetical protein
MGRLNVSTRLTSLLLVASLAVAIWAMLPQGQFTAHAGDCSWCNWGPWYDQGCDYTWCDTWDFGCWVQPGNNDNKLMCHRHYVQYCYQYDTLCYIGHRWEDQKTGCCWKP